SAARPIWTAICRKLPAATRSAGQLKRNERSSVNDVEGVCPRLGSFAHGGVRGEVGSGRTRAGARSKARAEEASSGAGRATGEARQGEARHRQCLRQGQAGAS